MEEVLSLYETLGGDKIILGEAVKNKVEEKEIKGKDKKEKMKRRRKRKRKERKAYSKLLLI